MIARSLARAGAVALAFVLLSAAAPPRKVYLQQHAQATREVRVRWHFTTAMILRATLLTEPVRRELAAERTRLASPTDADADAWLARSLDAEASTYEVVFAAGSGLDDADEFGNGDGGWTLTLLADGVEQPMLDVRHIRKPTPLQRALFPQLDLWSELWVARFSKNTPAQRDVTLRLGSGYGHGELRWDL